VNQNHEILARGLGVSHPKINKLVDECRKSGAYGAKLTGGGRGGAMFALVDEKNQNKVAKAIVDAGGKSYITKIGVEGLREE
jgi:mevalonate kinase